MAVVKKKKPIKKLFSEVYLRNISDDDYLILIECMKVSGEKTATKAVLKSLATLLVKEREIIRLNQVNQSLEHQLATLKEKYNDLKFDIKKVIKLEEEFNSGKNALYKKANGM